MAGNHNVLQSYVDPRASALQQMASGMDPAQKYLLAMAHRIAPSQLGLSAGQIYAAEQGLTGYHMDPRTGQITKANAMGGRDPVDPRSLLSTINTNLGGSFGMENGQMVHDASWVNGTPGTYNGGTPNMTGGSFGGGGGASNIGGGSGNPNNAAGLAGSAGNALRQMFMDSDQFNHNGANTYAIQNMNLTGNGGLGSNMGGMPSNGLFNGAISGSGTSTGGNGPGATPTNLGAPISDQTIASPGGSGSYTPRTTTPYQTANPQAGWQQYNAQNPASGSTPYGATAPSTVQPRTTTPYQQANPSAVSPAPSGSGTSMTPRYFTNPTQFQMPGTGGNVTNTTNTNYR